jgi:surface protein
MYLINSYRFKGAAPVNPDFTILVKTDNAGTSASNQFTISVLATSPNNYDVDWGDGNTDLGVTTDITHTYASAGTYTIKISNECYILFNNGGDKLKLLEIQNWGNFGGAGWPGLTNRFWGCSNMDITATDSFISTSGVQTNQAFYNCTNLIGNSSMNTWDVSVMSEHFRTFRECTNFNQDISNWDVSNATTLSQMLNRCTNFNQDISSWDVSNVTSFQGMFSFASSFDQNLGSWNLRTAGINLQAIFNNSGMSAANYTDTIVSWANYVFVNGGPLNTNMSTQGSMTFDTSRSGGANFANAGAARTYLTTATPTGAGWTISGDTVI